MLEIDNRHRYAGYDGAGNVEKWTRSFVRFADMTVPFDMPRAHWVLSSEVGEHVPNEREGMSKTCTC